MLPHPSLRRRLTRLLPWALLGLAVVLIWRGRLVAEHRQLERRIVRAADEVERLAPLIREIEQFKETKRTLERQIAIVSDLQLDRRPVAELLEAATSTRLEGAVLEGLEIHRGAAEIHLRETDPGHAEAFASALAQRLEGLGIGELRTTAGDAPGAYDVAFEVPPTAEEDEP